MIKPEGMHYQGEIRDYIGRHLSIGAIRRVTPSLPDWVLDELYDDLTPELRRATRAAFDGPVELGLVHGNDAIAQLLMLVGEKTSPAECHPDSIRHRFGIPEPVILEGVPYFRNAVHRPKTPEEAMTHIELFRRLPM